MSSTEVRISVNVVKLPLRIKGPLCTCIDVTPSRARIGRVLEISSLQVHRVPLGVLRGAQAETFDPAQLATLLYRVAHQYDASGMTYEKDTVQQVARALTEEVNAVQPVASDGRYSRRLTVD